MNKKPNFLDSEPDAFEKNLKFVRNELEEEFDQIFGGDNDDTMNTTQRPQLDYKIVHPEPGICIKCFKVNTNEKFFINLCQADGIPAPEDISEMKLNEILQSQKPSSYRIPMSISQPRVTKDNSGNLVDVCDIAINPRFFKKCHQIVLFRDFLLAIVFEALSEKYNIQISQENWMVLKNRKIMGKLVSHRIQNRDVKRVHDSIENPTESDNKIFEEIYNENKMYSNDLRKNTEKLTSEKKLVEEIDPYTEKLLLKNIKEQSNKNKQEMLLYTAEGRIENSKLCEIIIQLYLPKCNLSNDLDILHIGEDQIVLCSQKYNYNFEKFFPYPIDESKAEAFFHIDKKILEIHAPLINPVYK